MSSPFDTGFTLVELPNKESWTPEAIHALHIALASRCMPCYGIYANRGAPSTILLHAEVGSELLEEILERTHLHAETFKTADYGEAGRHAFPRLAPPHI